MLTQSPPLETFRVFRRKLLRWYGVHGRRFPWRETTNPFAILVSEILLHQTWAGKVVPVYEEVLAEYPTPHRLANANVRRLKAMLAPLGLVYRAKVLKTLGQAITDDFDEQVPLAGKALHSLPGVGPYTCNAIRCFAFGEKTAIVDTNVVRVASRFFGIGNSGSTTVRTRAVADAISRALPRRFAVRRFNYALLDFGATVCTCYAPSCTKCPLRRHCVAYTQGWHLPRNSRDKPH